VVKRKDFLLFMYFSLFIHAPVQRQAQALSVKVEIEADKLKLSVQKNGTVAILQFLLTTKVSIQEWTYARYWRMKAGYKYKFSLNKENMNFTNNHKPTYKRKIHQSISISEILLRYSIIFSDHLFKSITNYNLSFS